MELVADPADPRLDGYRRLNDARYRARWEKAHQVFVAEGHLAATRLLHSSYPACSLLVASPRAASMEALIREAEYRGAAVYVCPQPVVDAVAGFPAHRGVLALGRRRPWPAASSLLAAGGTFIGVEGVNDAENMGAISRNAAAFGAHGVLLDPTCCDPLSRRAVRVSVGHSLCVAFSRCAQWSATLAEAREAGAAVVALTPDPVAQPLDSVAAAVAASRPTSVLLLLGAEGPGLAPATIAACTLAARIPMQGGVDSLNVASAAAVALYALRRALGGGGR